MYFKRRRRQDRLGAVKQPGRRGSSNIRFGSSDVRQLSLATGLPLSTGIGVYVHTIMVSYEQVAVKGAQSI